MFFHKCQHRSSQRYENRTIIFKNVYFIFKKCLQREDVDKIEKYKVKIISALMRYAYIFAATNENWIFMKRTRVSLLMLMLMVVFSAGGCRRDVTEAA